MFSWENIIRIIIAILTALVGVYSGQHPRVRDLVQGHKRYVVDVPEGMSGVNMLTNMGGEVVKAMETRKAYVMKLSEGQASKLKALGHRVYEDRVYTIHQTSCTPKPGGPSDPKPTDPPVSGDQVDWGVARVRGIEAQGKLGPRTKVPVAILDTGIDTDHEDLKGVYSVCKSFVSGANTCEDDQGHGAHVAGIVAAHRNGKGVVGVAAGYADLMIGKVLDSRGSGYGSDIADGIKYMADNGAKIISMSLGSPAQWGPDPLIKSATDYAVGKGIYVVAANGNDSSGRVGYPAANPGVIGISSSNNRDQLSSFSTYGSDTDYIAPGSDILSVKMGGGYVRYSGTSMATPMVAGVLALCLASGKPCNPLKTDNLGLSADKQGKGLPNALSTVQ